MKELYTILILKTLILVYITDLILDSYTDSPKKQQFSFWTTYIWNNAKNFRYWIFCTNIIFSGTYTSSSGRISTSSVTSRKPPLSRISVALVIAPRCIHIPDPSDIEPLPLPLPTPPFKKAIARRIRSQTLLGSGSHLTPQSYPVTNLIVFLCKKVMNLLLLWTHDIHHLISKPSLISVLKHFLHEIQNCSKVYCHILFWWFSSQLSLNQTIHLILLKKQSISIIWDQNWFNPRVVIVQDQHQIHFLQKSSSRTISTICPSNSSILCLR